MTFIGHFIQENFNKTGRVPKTYEETMKLYPKHNPFKSKKQMRKFFAMENRGELPKGTAKRWAKETPNIKKLPLRKKKK